MSRQKLYRIAAVLAICSTVIVVTFGVALWAAAQPPDFYVEPQDPTALDDQADEFLRRWSSVVNMMQRTAEPVAVEIPGEEINAWLQRDLSQRLRNLLPVDLRNPRLLLTNDEFHLGFETKVAGAKCIVVLTGKAWVPSSDWLAIQLSDCSIGTLPLPCGLVARWLREALHEAKISAELRQHEGKPTLLVALPRSEDVAVRLLDLRIYRGRLYVSTARGGNNASQAESDDVSATADSTNSHSSSLRLMR